jgi:hypothetical protein
MSPFNTDAAQAARAANPLLSVFDTGEMLEPKIERTTDTVHKTGTVDFDNDESATICSIFAHPSTSEDDTTLIQIDTLAGGKFKVMLNDGVLFNGDIETKTEVEAILDRYAAVESEWSNRNDEEATAPISATEYERHDDTLTELLHSLVFHLREAKQMITTAEDRK